MTRYTVSCQVLSYEVPSVQVAGQQDDDITNALLFCLLRTRDHVPMSDKMAVDRAIAALRSSLGSGSETADATQQATDKAEDTPDA